MNALPDAYSYARIGAFAPEPEHERNPMDETPVESDRFRDGYSAARTHYERRAAETGAVTAEWVTPTDPLGRDARDAVRRAWPSLAAALDELTKGAPA